MNRRQANGALGFAAALEAAPADRDSFIGVWRLISCVRKSQDGRIDSGAPCLQASPPVYAQPAGHNPMTGVIISPAMTQLAHLWGLQHEGL